VPSFLSLVSSLLGGNSSVLHIEKPRRMPLIYTLVARGPVVLAEYALPTVSGNFQTVTRRILEKIPMTNGSKMSYTYDRHLFHYIVEDGLVYMTMSDETFGRRIPFAFLEDIRTRFRGTYGDRIRTALPGAMNDDFGRVIQVQMEYFSNNPNADKITKVKEQIDEVTNIMVQNIEKVLERGERIELLVDKTEALNANALNFKRQSTNLRRALFWKNVRLWIILALVLLVLAYIVAAIVCGPLFGDCIHHDQAPPATTRPPPPATTTAPPPPPTTTVPVTTTPAATNTTSPPLP
jgi:vesicle-associated membrane protein 7